MAFKNKRHVDSDIRQENNDIKPSSNESSLNGPIGVDVGTANIVVAQSSGDQVNTVSEINAFFTVPTLPTTRKILEKKDIMFFEIEDKLYILGNSAQNFANILGGSTKRPIENGLLNLKENEGIIVIKSLLNKLIRQPQQKGTKVIFSIPGDPVDSDGTVVSNEIIFKSHLQNLGYSPEPINEGLAVILSELSEDSATGIGISMGGGMCNVCLSYLSIPVVTYSIRKGGDYIDQMVGNSVGEPATRIKSIKEEDLDLTREPRNSIETGLHIYYDVLFSILIKSLHQTLKKYDEFPRLPHAIPIILSGGTVLPRGSKEKFEKAFRSTQLPFTISDVVIATDPLAATAKGALIMALS